MGSNELGRADLAAGLSAPRPDPERVERASASHSRFVQRIRRRYAAEIGWLAPGRPARESIVALVQRLQGSGRNFAAALRVARQLSIERLAVLDIEEQATLGDVTRSMTELAETTLDLALARAFADQDARFGVPRNAAGERIDFWVIGMGKLGARELNVSSDIDLIYLYEEDGTTDGAQALSAHEYFSHVARSLYALIGEVTEDGFVFRVDLALRPNGNSGPPVVSLAMLDEYLQSHGREWERFAWLKSPRRRAAGQRAERARAGAARARHALRLSPLSRLRRLRGPAPAARESARRSTAARRRPAAARQRRQALARRHPRDRIHRATAACRAAAASSPRSAPARR